MGRGGAGRFEEQRVVDLPLTGWKGWTEVCGQGAVLHTLGGRKWGRVRLADLRGSAGGPGRTSSAAPIGEPRP